MLIALSGLSQQYLLRAIKEDRLKGDMVALFPGDENLMFPVEGLALQVATHKQLLYFLAERLIAW